jgi:guanylate kinase
MKIETTIYLEPELVGQLHRRLATNGHGSLSELIERLLRSFLAKEEQPTKDLQDLQLINDNAEQLNREAQEVLTYQIEL